MLAVLAEFERDLVSERTKMALAHLKAQGVRLGKGAPYGFDEDEQGGLVENAQEQEVIRLIRKYHKQGWSLRKIGTLLDSKKIPTKQGSKWYAATVRSALIRSVS